MSWRPIDTAPRDGTEIFVYRRMKPWNVYGIAHWEECHGISGWLARGLFEIPGALGLSAPTHWLAHVYTPKCIVGDLACSAQRLIRRTGKKCHLNHDIRYHVSNAAKTRRLNKERVGQLPLI